MTPTNEAELAEAIKSAKGALRIIGGGTRDIGKTVVGEVISSSGLSGISLYQPGALTIVAQAGTPMAEIEAALVAENQRLAFEPMDHRALLGTSGTPTIGGVVSANISGPRRIAVGACRDHALGVRFVDGAGTITKNGGRVMKNVTGYDLVKLLTGAYGTLGVLSEVSLKVLPNPETSATLVLQGLSVSDSVAAMTKALGSPFEVTGAATSGLAASGVVPQTCIRIEGFERSVTYRLTQLENLLAAFGDIHRLDHDASQGLWRDIRDLSSFSNHTAVSRVSVKPSAAPEVAQAVWDQFRADLTLDWGGGLMWFGITEAHDQDATGDGCAAVHRALQDIAGRHGGHATLIKAPQEVRAQVPLFQPENPTVAALSQGLRARFDPRSILNTGLMG